MLINQMTSLCLDEGGNTADMMSETDFATGLDPVKIRATMRVILKTRDS